PGRKRHDDPHWPTWVTLGENMGADREEEKRKETCDPRHRYSSYGPVAAPSGHHIVSRTAPGVRVRVLAAEQQGASVSPDRNDEQHCAAALKYNGPGVDYLRPLKLQKELARPAGFEPTIPVRR